MAISRWIEVFIFLKVGLEFRAGGVDVVADDIDGLHIVAAQAVGGGSVDVLQAAAGGIRRTRKQSRQGQNKAADGHADVGHGQGALSVKWINIINNKDNQ